MLWGQMTDSVSSSVIPLFQFTNLGFSLLSYKMGIRMSTTWVCGGELHIMKCLGQLLAYSKCLLNGSYYFSIPVQTPAWGNLSIFFHTEPGASSPHRVTIIMPYSSHYPYTLHSAWHIGAQCLSAE